MLNLLFERLGYKFLNIQNKMVLNDIKHRSIQIVGKVRKKDKIRILFILNQLSKWKTESLYIEMLKHPRFEPIIGVALGIVDYPSYESRNFRELVDYLNGKGYSYTELRLTSDIQDRIRPDIVFYQQADGGIYECLNYIHLHDILFCYVAYGVANGTAAYAYNQMYHNACWYWFVENKLVIDYASTVMDNHAKNLVPTGTPMMDELLSINDHVSNPWKLQDCSKKRIIWSPHHTIGLGKEEIHYGTFLDVADDMVTIAKKYYNEVQWAFKPHPSLKQKLYYLWGEKRTDDYWAFWRDMNNSQLEEGKYASLFQFSDAMVHDCGTFTTEYLYMRKPCMYLVNGKEHSLNDFGKACYNLYYKGHNAEDIEQFVQNVINDIDPRKEERDKFFNDYLLPPNGKTACQNIIDSILGQ